MKLKTKWDNPIKLVPISNSLKNSKLFVPAIVAGTVLIIDQWSKIWVKTHMYLGQEYRLTNWFYIHFTENPGMAFGMELGGDYGKILLSLFRIAAIIGIAWYIIHLSKKEAHQGFLIAMGFIFAGALGNILDSVFYGQIFTESSAHIAQNVPFGDGYAGMLHGKVVDMLYFPLFDGWFPDWFPIWGGDYFMFFRPVFNVADSAITVGVAIIILFQKSFFAEEL